MLFLSDDCGNKYYSQNNFIDAEAVLTSSEEEDHQSNTPQRLSDDYATSEHDSVNPFGGSTTESIESSESSIYSGSSHSTSSLNLK